MNGSNVFILITNELKKFLINFGTLIEQIYKKLYCMKNKAFNKKTITILSAIVILVAGALALKMIADSESRVDY